MGFNISLDKGITLEKARKSLTSLAELFQRSWIIATSQIEDERQLRAISALADAGRCVY
jgi:hypothetical protein